MRIDPVVLGAFVMVAAGLMAAALVIGLLWHATREGWRLPEREEAVRAQVRRDVAQRLELVRANRRVDPERRRTR